MKQTTKFFKTLVAFLLLSTTAFAANQVTVIKLLNGSANDNAGTVTSSISNGTCTLTVTPATGNFITVDNIIAVKTTDGGSAQAPSLTPNISDAINVFAVSTTADPSGETQYTFTMPSSEYDVEVTADFQLRTNIADACMLTLDIPEAGYVYDGKEKKPGVILTQQFGEAEEELAEDNYTVVYSDNVNAGEATVKVTGLGIYTGTLSRTFTIAKADFTQVVIADIADQVYTGSAITPTVSVTFNGQKVAASEYEVTYLNNIETGTATVQLTSKEVNFAQGETSPSKNFEIVAVTATITGTDQTVTFNGNAQEYTNGSVTKGSVLVKYYLSEENRTNGEKSLEGAPADAGVYYVQLLQGDPNTTSDPVNVLFTINPKTLTEDMVELLIETPYVYDGEAQTPEVSVYDEEVEPYEMSESDYEVSYVNNINVGTATVTFTGKGNYTGSVNKTFKILRKLNVSFSENNTWASYFAAENLNVPTGLKAYIVSEVTDNTVTVSEISYIPQGVAVILNAVEQPTESLTTEAYEGTTQTFENNLLQGCSQATAVSSLTANNAVYLLYNNEFVKTVSGTIPAFRCYLPISKNQNASASLFIIEDNDKTGINAIGIDHANVTKGWYDLNGRRLSTTPATKGMYILNGKKYIIK